MAIRKANILLFGAGGTGKTEAVTTLLKPEQLERTPDLKIRFLSTETNALYGLESGIARNKIEPKPGQLSVMVAKVAYNPKSGMNYYAKAFKDNFQDVSASEAMKVRVNSGDRSYHSEFYNVLKGTANFKGVDWATGETIEYGDVLQFDSDTIFVVDSLTTIVNMLVKVVRGSRMIAGRDEYKDVQGNLKNLVLVQFSEIMSKASFILLGHSHLGKDQNVKQPTQAEVDDVKTGKEFIMKLYPDVYGQAMNGLQKYFTETIYTWLDEKNDKYYWAGRKDGVETSVRMCPAKDKLEPDFSKYPIFVPSRF